MSINEWVEQFLTKPSRLLIVDDADGIADVIKTALHGYECDYETCATGEQAINRIQNGRFDLIFLDMVLPGINGVEVLKEVKRVAPETPVVVMTGFFNSELLDEASQLGIVAFMRKPADFTPAFIKQVFQLFKLRGAPGPQSIFSHGRDYETATTP